MLGLVHITLADLNCRVRFDHVPPDANPADGLSRDGLADPWTRLQPWDRREVSRRDYAALVDLDQCSGHASRLTAKEQAEGQVDREARGSADPCSSC